MFENSINRNLVRTKENLPPTCHITLPLPLPLTNTSSLTPTPLIGRVGTKRPAGTSPKLQALAKRMRNEQNVKLIPLEKALNSNSINLIKQFLSQYTGCKTDLFFCATKQQNITFLFVMLKDGFDVNTQGNNDFTALHHAAYYDLPKVFIFLLLNGAALYAKTSSDRYPLDLVKDDSRKKVNLLNKHGFITKYVKVNFIPEPICVATQKGDLKKVLEILEEDEVMVDAIEYNTNRTPLSFAVEMGNLEVVRTLLRYSADVKNCKFNGDNVLVSAAKNNQVEIFHELFHSTQAEFTDELLFDAFEECLLNESDQKISDTLWGVLSKKKIYKSDRYPIINNAVENSKEALVKKLVNNYSYNINYYDCIIQACEVYFNNPKSNEAKNILQFLLNHHSARLTELALLSLLSEQTDKTFLRKYLDLLLDNKKEVWLAEQIEKHPEFAHITEILPKGAYLNCVNNLEEARRIAKEYEESEYFITSRYSLELAVQSSDEDECEVIWRYFPRSPLQHNSSSQTPEEELKAVVKALTGGKNTQATPPPSLAVQSSDDKENEVFLRKSPRHSLQTPAKTEQYRSSRYYDTQSSDDEVFLSDSPRHSLLPPVETEQYNFSPYYKTQSSDDAENDSSEEESVVIWRHSPRRTQQPVENTQTPEEELAWVVKMLTAPQKI